MSAGRGVSPMKVLRWIVGIPIGVFIVVFAVANRHDVTVRFDPLPFAAEWPLYGVAFAGLVLGFVGGVAAAWLGGHRARRDARANKRKAATLERDLARRDAAPETSRGALTTTVEPV